MPILPKPYPDELVGSVIVRACRHTGLSAHRLLRGIFGSKRSSYSFLLGENVSELAYRAGLEPRELLVRHTVFPYSVAFMASEVQEQLVSKALGLRPGMGNVSSLTKNFSHSGTHLRVCKLCIADELKIYGESYWHREHSLPGMLVCRLHNHRPLSKTNITLRGQIRGDAGTLPHELTNLTPVERIPQELSIRLAAVACEALNHDIPRSSSWLRLYRERAIYRGYVLPNGDVAGTLLAYDLGRLFGPELLSITRCSVATNPRIAWPTLMVRSVRNMNFASPKHVFMRVFLESEHSAPTNLSGIYQSPGKRARDYGDMDTSTVAQLRTHIERATLVNERVTIQALLRAVGAWSAFRHHRTEFTETAALLEEFKRSDQSERQTGGRPYWRKRLPSRFGAADTGGHTSLIEGRSESEPNSQNAAAYSKVGSR